ncbi:MAG TPA: hypothetical protein VEZ51_11940 [Gemmatimonadaceae bacterium]|nr:hypothetical protein [Gemmatimonadaceae bacterium]
MTTVEVRPMDGEGEGGLKYWLTRGALIGLIVLGIGGRILMRIIAHMEHRPLFVFTVAGTLSVVLAGTVAGLFAGLIYYLTRRFIKQPLLRTALFTTSCELIVWRGVHGLLPVPQLMFMTLALIYLAIIDTIGRRMHS